MGVILGALNTVVVLAVLGLFVYTKVIFKHAPITEGKERSKLEALKKKIGKAAAGERMLINLDPITANLDPFKDDTGKEKSHFISMSISIEISDETEQGKFEEAKPVVLDKILQIIAKKRFEDLNQVQGRYVFRSQIIDAANEYLGKPIVSEVYFSDFLLQ